MKAPDIQPWLFHVEPMAGESLSHFLGRVRRRNHLSPSALGKMAGIGAKIARWERFHLNSLVSLSGTPILVPLDARQLSRSIPTF